MEANDLRLEGLGGQNKGPLASRGGVRASACATSSGGSRAPLLPGLGPSGRLASRFPRSVSRLLRELGRGGPHAGVSKFTGQRPAEGPFSAEMFSVSLPLSRCVTLPKWR